LRPSTEIYSILLKKIVILNNRKLFGSADVVIFSVAANGIIDLKSGPPVWTQELRFGNIRDGAILPIDPDAGVLLFRGRARAFLNLYLFVIRDMESARQFAGRLRDSFLAEGIGAAVGAAAAGHGLSDQSIRDSTTKLVRGVLNQFTKLGDKALGAYYASFLRENNYGTGLHPANYPASLLKCGEAVDMAYQVTMTS